MSAIEIALRMAPRVSLVLIFAFAVWRHPRLTKHDRLLLIAAGALVSTS